MSEKTDTKIKLGIEYFIKEDGKTIQLPNPENMNAERLTAIVMDIYEHPEKYKTMMVETTFASATITEADDTRKFENITCTSKNNLYLTALQKKDV